MELGKLAIWPAAPKGKPKSKAKVLVASLFKIRDLVPLSFAKGEGVGQALGAGDLEKRD